MSRNFIRLTQGVRLTPALGFEQLAINEHSSPGTLVGHLSVTGGGTGDWTFSIENQTVEDVFSIDVDRLETGVVPAVAEDGPFSLTVRANRGFQNLYGTYTIEVVDVVPDSDAFIGISGGQVVENTGPNESVALLVVIGGTGAEIFTVTGDVIDDDIFISRGARNQDIVTGAVVADYETAPVAGSGKGYSIHVETDTGLTADFVIPVANVLEVLLNSLTLADPFVNEGSASGVTVSAINGFTSGSARTLVDSDSGRFALSGTNVVTAATIPSSASEPTFEIEIRETADDAVPRHTRMSISNKVVVAGSVLGTVNNPYHIDEATGNDSTGNGTLANPWASQAKILDLPGGTDSAKMYVAFKTGGSYLHGLEFDAPNFFVTTYGPIADGPVIFDDLYSIKGTAGVTWTNLGSNRWQRAMASTGTAGDCIVFDGFGGKSETALANVNRARTYQRSTTAVTIFSTSDPATAFTTLEACRLVAANGAGRSQGIYAPNLRGIHVDSGWKTTTTAGFIFKGFRSLTGVGIGSGDRVLHNGIAQFMSLNGVVADDETNTVTAADTITSTFNVWDSGSPQNGSHMLYSRSGSATMYLGGHVDAPNCEDCYQTGGIGINSGHLPHIVFLPGLRLERSRENCIDLKKGSAEANHIFVCATNTDPTMQAAVTTQGTNLFLHTEDSCLNGLGSIPAVQAQEIRVSYESRRDMLFARETSVFFQTVSGMPSKFEWSMLINDYSNDAEIIRFNGSGTDIEVIQTTTLPWGGNGVALSFGHVTNDITVAGVANSVSSAAGSTTLIGTLSFANSITAGEAIELLDTGEILVVSRVHLNTGTVRTTAGSTTLTGTGTKFSTELAVGMSIQVVDTTETRVIANIASDTSLTVTVAFNTTDTSSTFRRPSLNYLITTTAAAITEAGSPTRKSLVSFTKIAGPVGGVYTYRMEKGSQWGANRAVEIHNLPSTGNSHKLNSPAGEHYLTKNVTTNTQTWADIEVPEAQFAGLTPPNTVTRQGLLFYYKSTLARLAGNLFQGEADTHNTDGVLHFDDLDQIRPDIANEGNMIAGTGSLVKIGATSYTSAQIISTAAASGNLRHDTGNRLGGSTSKASTTPINTRDETCTIVYGNETATVTTSSPHGLTIGRIYKIGFKGAVPDELNGASFCTITGASTMQFQILRKLWGRSQTAATGTIKWTDGKVTSAPTGAPIIQYGNTTDLHGNPVANSDVTRKYGANQA